MPKRKIVKKTKKKAAKNKSKTKVAVIKVKKDRPIGRVTHYFGNIMVGIFKFKKPVKVGDEIQIRGATTDFKQIISSMQYDHKDIKTAAPNKEVGIKVKKMVREGDLIFK